MTKSGDEKTKTGDRPEKRAGAGKKSASDFAAGLEKLTQANNVGERHLGARLRNYFLTGLIIVGPVTITLYIIWSFVHFADAWIKPFVPVRYLPETYLPFAVPGIGLIFGILGLTIVGALAANLLGRTLISSGELMLDRMPIVRNVYRALKQIFESVISAAAPGEGFQKVGLIQFPSKGLWSIVFVTSETSGEIGSVKPGGESDLLTVFMPTGVVPPTGFVCFIPRKDVILLKMSAEDAAKIIISAGMVTPDHQATLKGFAAAARRQLAAGQVKDQNAAAADGTNKDGA